MAFKDTYAVAVNPDHVVRKQFAGALHSIASDLRNDPATQGDTLTWARRIRDQGPVAEAGKWIWLMLTNATFAADPTAALDGVVKDIAVSFLATMVKA
jgi:DNA-binding LytR/AlgR family response regulator